MRERQTHPGSQRRVNRLNPLSIPIYLLFTLVSFLVLHAFIKENVDFATFPAAFVWKLNLLKVNDALMLLVALLGLLVARQQVELSVTPRLMYSCYPTAQSQFGLQVQQGRVIWTCKVKNVGSGMAIVRRCAYRVTESVSKSKRKQPFNLSYLDVVKLLRKKGLEPGRDYVLMQYSIGAVIGGGEEQTLLEVNRDALDALKVVDVELVFDGFLGERFEKQIFMVPRDGIANHVENRSVSGSQPLIIGSAS